MSTVVGELERAGFEVLSRENWHTQHEPLYQRRRQQFHPTNNPDGRPFDLPAKDFFAHVTVTPDSGKFTGDFKEDVRLVERIGFERFGTGISYTWIVDQRSGLIAKGHPIDAKGAHTLNDKGVSGFPFDLNAWGHAIAWIAMPGDKPSDKCIRSFAAIIAASKKVNVAREDAKLLPHSKFAVKDCPLESLRKHIPDIMRMSKNILGEKNE